MKNAMPRLILVVVMIESGLAECRADEAASPTQVFEQRLLPIFKSDQPSSCVQCHLAGVDLKNYIKPSSDDTFRSLRDQGLVNLDQPERSKILKLINMKDTDNPGANLLHAKVREAEAVAFAEWLKACCNDPKLRNAPKLSKDELAKPARPDEVIRYARTDRLLESFEQNIWGQRHRCMGCHTEGSEQNRKLVEKNGEQVAWMKKSAAETMTYLIRTKHLIEIDNPEQSLLLLKPLKEVDHGGGKKFLKGDLGYKGFRTWLEDYAKVVRDEYSQASDLPKSDPRKLRPFSSELWFKLTNTAPEWNDKLLQVTIHRWDDHAKKWEAAPVAISDRQVGGNQRIWQHTLTLLAEPGSQRARHLERGSPALPPGAYLVKVHVDRADRTLDDWQATMRDEDFVGQAEFRAEWRPGYGTMTAVDAAKVQK
ncbi:MAG TPA: hypothetical protein VK137_06860 [Planctomycetaceae bacterium]|nr:hypothetical protein [Planctomycetaceae bacterium]